MKNILKKFLLIFVIGILSQPYIENTCWGMNTIDMEAISKLEKEDIMEAISKLEKEDIWKIISVIAQSGKQPELRDKIENIVKNEEVVKKCKSFKTATFAEFVKNLNGDTLFQLVTSKRGTKEEIIPIISIKNDSEGKHINTALNNICQKVSGRLLLIRLLIAVMKSNAIKNKSEYELTIEDKNGEFCHADGPQHITLDIETLKTLKYTLFSNPDNGTVLMTSDLDENLKNVDVALFHEMVHVFHGTNNLKKNKGYRRGFSYSLSSSDYNDSNVIHNPLFKYYFKDFVDSKKKIDDTNAWKSQMMPWHVLTTEGVYRVNFEEMLTIAGLPVATEGYEPGDELSENLYREEKGLPLRFSHKMFTYYESEDVYKKVKDCVKTNLKKIGSEYTEVFPEKEKTDPIQITGGSSKKCAKINYRKIEIEENGKIKTIKGLDKQEGFNGMHYYTINPLLELLHKDINITIKEKFKYPLNMLIINKTESIDYYLRSEYNEWVFNRFKFY